MVYRQLLIFCLQLFIAGFAFSADIADMSFSELPGNRVEVRTTFTAPPVLPQGYSIEKPARIVLDFAETESNLSSKRYSLGLNNLKSTIILTAQGRTRVIFNLESSAAYTNTVQGNVLTTIIDNSQAENKTFTLSQKQAPQDVTEPSTGNVITDIDFRRDAQGEGKILFSLNDPKVSVDVERRGNNIDIVFAETSINETLQRRLDVIDFATPVQFIETRSKGDAVNVRVEADGQYEYLAYQTDEVYVVSIAPLSEAEIQERQEQFKYVGEKLSLNFQDIQVRKVLEIIADFTELNLVASDTVSGNITLRLENVPWDQALDLVLKSKGLDKRQSGNVLLVAPAAEIAERERQELESRKQLQELEPLSTEFIQVRYAKAQDILTLISGSGAESGEAQSSSVNNVLSVRGSAAVDERTNSIILTDISANIEGIKELIEKVDIPIRQVMIEARIVSASDSFRKELGATLTASEPTDRTTNELLGGNINIATPITQAASGTFSIDFLPGDIELNLEITALENAGYGEVISQPRILTGDKQTAKIENGQQVPFTSSDGTSVRTIFQDAVLSLEVTPQITPDNRIIMELKVNRDSLDTDTVTASGSPINVTELTTTALVGDGDTIVLGGIFEQNKSVSESKVPVLGDIPLVGRLFRNNVNVDDRSELLIFITPRILTDTILDQ